jgi:hypothetical protein
VTLVDWPLRDRPIAALATLMVIGAATWLAVWATGNSMLGAAIAAILALTAWRTILPVRYEFTASGILQSVLGRRRRIPWTAVRAYELRSDGVLLSPDPDIAPLTGLRGFYLHWGRQRDAVLAHLEYYVISAPARAGTKDSKVA